MASFPKKSRSIVSLITCCLLCLCCPHLHAQTFTRQELPVKLVSAVACADLDNNGVPEILAATPSQLHLLSNTGGAWQVIWSSQANQTPQTSAAVYLLDLNNDGLKDILALDDATSDDNDTHTQHAIWLQNEPLQFSHLPETWLPDHPSPSATLAWRAQDDALELFVAAQFGEAHQLYRTTENGPVAIQPSWQPGPGAHITSAAWLDLDNDFDTDLAAINYQGEDIFLQNFSVLGPDSIINLPRVTGQTTPNATAAIWADLNADQLPDLFLPSYGATPDRFFWNRGDMTFEQDTNLPFANPNQPTWTAGATWFDLENDGDLDLLTLDNFAGVALYRNRGNAQFEQISSADLGELDNLKSFGGAIVPADFNRDGLLDLLIPNAAGVLAIYQNNHSRDQNYLGLRLVTESGATAYGAQVRLQSSASTNVTSQQLIGGSQTPGAQSPPQLHFGIGQATTISSVEITWPDGTQETYRNLARNQQLSLIQGRADQQTRLIYPWISNNQGQFESTLYAANFNPFEVAVVLTATRPSGQQETVTRAIPANGFLEADAANLFTNLGSGRGYHVSLSAPVNKIAGRWITFNRTSDSGASPSQGVAINSEAAAPDLAQIGRSLVFSYLPVNQGFISSPVLVNLGTRSTSVALSFYSQSETLGGYFVENLEPGVPFAQVTTGLTATDQDYVMCIAESNISDITGVGFVFNSVFGEAAIGNATISDDASGLGNQFIFPWISNNAGNFESVVVLNNTGQQNISASLTATRFDGSSQTVSQQISANRMRVTAASELFPELGSGSGYSVLVTHDGSGSQLHGSWVTNALNAPSGASPSMGVAVHPQQAGSHKRAGTRMFVGFLPANPQGTSSAVVVNVGDLPTDVVLSLYNQSGTLMGQRTIEQLAPQRPWAQTAQSILNQAPQTVYAIAESSDQPITAVTFVFNQRGEPAIGNGQAIAP